MKKASLSVPPSAEAPVSFKGYRFAPDIICYAVWLYYRFPLSLRMVEEMLAARGIERKRLSSTVVQVVDDGDSRRYRIGSTRAVSDSDGATFHGSSSSTRLAAALPPS